jgi:Xaa-Pro aminopeptidase
MTAFTERRGLGQYFMGIGERKTRFTSHGLGLELDEFPFIAQGQKLAIKKNMVIAMEPKIIFPGIGVVGIENTHIVNDNGLETLTCYPDDIKVLSV